MQKIIQQKDKMSLKRLVAKCSLDRVDIVSAFRAKNSIGSLELEEIKAKSAGAALFYLWVSCILLYFSSVLSVYSLLYLFVDFEYD